MTARSAIGWSVIGLILGLYESTVATFLPVPFSRIDVVLLLVVYLMFRQRVYASYVVAVFAGVVLDVFAPDIAEGTWLKYILIAVLLLLISKRFLTNYSMYSVVALTGLAQVVAWMWRAVLGVIFPVLSLHLGELHAWNQFGHILFIDFMCVCLLFLIDTFVSKRFVHFSGLAV